MARIECKHALAELRIQMSYDRHGDADIAGDVVTNLEVDEVANQDGDSKDINPVVAQPPRDPPVLGWLGPNEAVVLVITSGQSSMQTKSPTHRRFVSALVVAPFFAHPWELSCYQWWSNQTSLLIH